MKIFRSFWRVGLTLSVFLFSIAVALAGPQPAISIVAPQDGATVTGPNIPFAVALNGLTVDCASAGKTPREGIGHWHVILDGGLVDMACGAGYLVSLRNVKPGPHTLMAVPALNNHMEIKEGAAKVSFTYQPGQPLPSLVGFNAGTPRLAIKFPKNGATVSGETFPLIIDIENFRLSCELFGKPNLANSGHWHVHLDKMAPGMAGMATMMAMGCSNTFEVSLRGIAPGAHTFIVILTDNLHAPITPMVTAQVTVTVK